MSANSTSADSERLHHKTFERTALILVVSWGGYVPCNIKYPCLNGDETCAAALVAEAAISQVAKLVKTPIYTLSGELVPFG